MSLSMFGHVPETSFEKTGAHATWSSPSITT